jgi:propionyl-CoA carboxylase alpha chain
VIKTCKKLGIKTVAVYSDADANAKHVRMADETYYIGPSPVSQSYLRAEKILQAMRETGAQAVHPGYGFLSENAEFARQVEKEGFVFIGPPADAIDAMGDKIQSKKIAEHAKVNIIPGFQGEVESANEAKKIAAQIGYPVMIKASAGGGGKGMRIIWNDSELDENFKLCQDEALRNFNSKKMLVEKFIQNPRHIEIQVIADKHGNVLYLPERECSIQRRNQKVIEEAPSMAIDDKTRRAMGEQAAQLARAVGYVSAGTVEMLIDQDKNFYFLEMNTRLQVEHPITEYITGLDLVELMIRAAAGLPLGIKQEDVKLQGWATECRVYAEDPTRNFAPSVGNLETYVEPYDSNGNIRVDSGILQGSEISVFYDPMISKLVTYGQTRDESLKKMVDALDTYIIVGLKHNIPLLRSVIIQDRYKSGNLTTKYLDEEFPEGFHGIQLTNEQHSHLIACSALVEFLSESREYNVTQRLQHASTQTEGDYVITYNDSTYDVSVHIEHGLYVVEIEGTKRFVVKPRWEVGTVIFRASLNDKYNITMQVIDRKDATLTIQFMGTEFNIEVRTPKEKELKQYMPYYPPPDVSKLLISPMPGSVVSVAVKPGDKVNAGQELLVMEAMKMQNVLKARDAFTIKSVNVKPGDVVGNEHIMIEFE